MLKQPIGIYSTWTLYDAAGDPSELTEEVALHQLDHFLHIRHLGLSADYFLLERDWFDPNGGFRAWKKPGWAGGPQRWLQRCVGNSVKSGLWIRGNTLGGAQPVPEWRNSLNWSLTAMCLFSGGYLNHFLDTLEFWYGKGIRLFKIDEMDFTVGTPEMEADLLPSEIWSANCAAFREGLKDLRLRCPEVVLLAGKGFLQQPAVDYKVEPGDVQPFRKLGDPRWAEVFDAQCAGELCPSRQPISQLWRSLEVQTDQRIHEWNSNGFPLAQIANCGLSLGSSRKNFNRNMHAWKSAALFGIARGGSAFLFQGDLTEIDEEKVHWLVAAQLVYANLLKTGATVRFGGSPARGEAYGYLSFTEYGAWLVVMNPSQRETKLLLPTSDLLPNCEKNVRVHFCDKGFLPSVKDDEVTLAPEQMVLLGVGKLAGEEYELGVEEDMPVPVEIAPINVEWESISGGLRGTISYLPRESVLRFIVSQYDAQSGRLRRSSPEEPLTANSAAAENASLQIHASIGGKKIQCTHLSPKPEFIGITGWLVAECEVQETDKKGALLVEFTSSEQDVALKADVYSVQYKLDEVFEKPPVMIA